MQKMLVALAVFAFAGCTPPAPPAETETPPVAVAPADLGPYQNSWDSAEFSRFRHSLNAPTGGRHELTLQAVTDAPGGETVAVYPVGADGAVATTRIMFVIATTVGNSETGTLDFATDIPLPIEVEVVVENAGGRRSTGTYTLTIARWAE